MAKVLTFGCRLNAFESQVIDGLAQGLDDTVVINTCAVTAEAERQARQAIRRARRENPSARIVVTGCAAQIDPARYAGMAEVDRVLGNQDKLAPAAWRRDANDPVVVSDIMAVRETAQHLVDGFDGRSRAFVEIQQGCDHRCTFCVIPYGRGNNRSVPIGVVAEHVRRLVEQGFAEVVLTGVDITGYGADLPGRPSLGQLVRRLLAAVPELPRLRLSSIDPAETDPELMRAIAEEDRLMPHLHLSVQAGDDMVLKRMKRRHTRAQVIDLVAQARALRPGIAFGADLIAGFPTESEDMFRRTLDLVEECGLSFLHIFPYSERPGTPAARMPQVPKAERKARAARLRAAGDRALAAFLDSQVGREVTVLAEDGGAGRTEHYAPARLARPAEPGAVVPARITGSDGRTLSAEAA